MKCRGWRGLLVAVAILAGTVPLWAQEKEKPTESEHVRGPNGLEGWTLESPVPDSGYGDEKFAFTLVIARDGCIVRRIDGDPIIWRWIFWESGRRVAYETGPFHFGVTCILVDVKTGRRTGSVDCYHELPKDVPDWVEALEASK
jgi:hypothetical protein